MLQGVHIAVDAAFRLRLKRILFSRLFKRPLNRPKQASVVQSLFGRRIYRRNARIATQDRLARYESRRVWLHHNNSQFPVLCLSGPLEFPSEKTCRAEGSSSNEE